MNDAPIPDPTPLLLSSTLGRQDVARLLRPYGFERPAQADANLQSMAGHPEERRALSVILAELLRAVGETADPDQALNAWEHYIATGIQRRSLFQFLHQAPRMLHLLCMIFGNSPAMAETLIRDPMLLYWLVEERVDTRSPTRKQMENSLRTSLAMFQSYERKGDALRRFKRREMLRIGIRDLLRVADVAETVCSLSNMATVLIQAVYELVDEHLRAQHGAPSHRNRHGRLVQTGFVVMGMGKLGGGELNYSSDVDLVYVYQTDEGETQTSNGLTPMSNNEYFEKLAREITHVLDITTDEGAIFRVDLRLRPEGDVGALAKSLEDSVHYYRTRGRDWERMAFIKAYPIAGTKSIGRSFLRRIRSFIHGQKQAPSEHVIQTVRSLKVKIHAKLRQRGEETRHVKLGIGGIREIEFLVQALQLLHVHQSPHVMERNTLKALALLGGLQILSAESVGQLDAAYRFLRDLEHKLQMVNDLQTHVLPSDIEEVAKCAVRMGYTKGDAPPETAQAFLDEYDRHTSIVHRLYQQTIGI
ncbi:[protein-PII] uridylyltransferase family protein [Nitrospira sp. M1]